MTTNAKIMQPATLDLRHHARNGSRWLKATDSKKLAESGDGWWVGWGYGDVTGRMVDAFILVRQILGEQMIPPEEERTRHFLLSLFDPEDGLSYRPKPIRMAHMFDQSSVLFGLVSWYLESGSLEMERYLDNLVSGLWQIAAKKDDYCYYPLEAYSSGGWDENYPVKFGLDKFVKADPCHEGGRQILPLVKYYELTESQTALLLAQGLASYVMHYSEVFEADGSYLEKRSRVHGHVHSRLATAAGILKLGLVTEKQELVKWAKRVYDWTLQTLSSTFGWVPEVADNFEHGSEGCAITDAIEIAIMLAQAGFEDYWNVAERFARNHLLENQCPKTGGFSCHSMPNDFCWNRDGVIEHEVSGCCSPAGVRALFLVWDHIVTRAGDWVKVNFALNRSTKWVEVQSLLPHKGEMKLVVKDAPNLAVRVPDWVDKSKVEVFLNGKLRSFDWTKNFVRLFGLKQNDEVVVKYPLRRLTLAEDLFGHKFDVSWRGDTVIAISPTGAHEPLYQRSHLDTDEVSFVEVEPQKFLGKEVHW